MRQHRPWHESHGKPNEKIKIEYILPDDTHLIGLTDEVRFVVVAPDSFYYELTLILNAKRLCGGMGDFRTCDITLYCSIFTCVFSA